MCRDEVVSAEVGLGVMRDSWYQGNAEPESRNTDSVDADKRQAN